MGTSGSLNQEVFGVQVPGGVLGQSEASREGFLLMVVVDSQLGFLIRRQWDTFLLKEFQDGI